MIAAAARRRRPLAPAALLLAGMLAASGCGDDTQSGSAGRAQPSRTISTVITPSRVTASPSSFAAGTIELLVSNQTSTTRSLELRSRHLASGGSPLVQRTGPIPPDGTSTLTAGVDQGSYRLSAPGSGIDPTTIAVGPAQANAIDRLLQP